MKKDKSKSKSHESTIGKIIYGFLLFLPLFAIGVTCGYAMFNKNANQSFTYENIDRVTDVTSTSMFIEGKNYNANYYTDSNRTAELFIYYSYADIDYSALGLDETLNWIFVKFYSYSSSHKIRFGTDTNYTVDLNTTWGNELKTFTFTYAANPNTNLNNYNKSSINFQLITYQKQITSKDVFYYSIDKVQESPLFNWAQNSIVYTTLTTTCTALSINNTFIPLLLAYWLIISIIYILYDIALVMLMIFHRKVHELQECI